MNQILTYEDVNYKKNEKCRYTINAWKDIGLAENIRKTKQAYIEVRRNRE